MHFTILPTRPALVKKNFCFWRFFRHFSGITFGRINMHHVCQRIIGNRGAYRLTDIAELDVVVATDAVPSSALVARFCIDCSLCCERLCYVRCRACDGHAEHDTAGNKGGLSFLLSLMSLPSLFVFQTKHTGNSTIKYTEISLTKGRKSRCERFGVLAPLFLLTVPACRRWG